MKAVVCGLVAGCFVAVSQADTIIFEQVGSESFTEAFDGTLDAWATNSFDSLGIDIYAKSGHSRHQLNGSSTTFGINNLDLNSAEGDTAGLFDVGEKMVLKFSERVSLDRMDFNSFSADEEFVIAAVGQPFFQITNDDLDNKSTDIIDLGEGIIVEKDTEVSFYSTAGSIGLDSVNITVIPEPTVLSLIGLFGIGSLAARRLRR